MNRTNRCLLIAPIYFDITTVLRSRKSSHRFILNSEIALLSLACFKLCFAKRLWLHSFIIFLQMGCTIFTFWSCFGIFIFLSMKSNSLIFRPIDSASKFRSFSGCQSKTRFVKLSEPEVLTNLFYFGSFSIVLLMIWNISISSWWLRCLLTPYLS